MKPKNNRKEKTPTAPLCLIEYALIHPPAPGMKKCDVWMLNRTRNWLNKRAALLLLLYLHPNSNIFNVNLGIVSLRKVLPKIQCWLLNSNIFPSWILQYKSTVNQRIMSTIQRMINTKINIVISQFLECRFNSEFSAIRICLKHLQFYNQIFRSNLFILYQHAIFQFSVTTKCFHYIINRRLFETWNNNVIKRI